MEGQVKEDVDDDMFSKTSSNFSGMAAHTLVWNFTSHFFFTCIGFIFFGTANKLPLMIIRLCSATISICYISTSLTLAAILF